MASEEGAMSPTRMLAEGHLRVATGGGAPADGGIAVRHLPHHHPAKKDGVGGKTEQDNHEDVDSLPSQELKKLANGNNKVPGTLDGYKRLVVPIVEEYFCTGDVELAACELRGLGSDQFQHYFVKKLISMAMDRHDKEKEMASVLLSSLYADVLSSYMISEGFIMLLESIEDLTVDIPDAVDVLAVFIARAVVDEILPPVFLARARALLPEFSKGIQVLQVVEKSYLSAPHHAELVERKWGGSTHFTVEEAKKRIQALVLSGFGLKLMQRPMDATGNRASVVIKLHQTVNESNSSPSNPATDHSQRKCDANEITEQIPLAANPSILLHLLSSYELEPNDLAALEGTCKFFRSPANFEPDAALSLPELAALDTCCQKAMFKSMKHEEKEKLKQRCGGSWKLVLGYLMVGERNYRREKSQVIAGLGHSIVVTTKGDVYSFGANRSGQLGLGNTKDQFEPCLIRSLQGIRITQAAVGSRQTMLVTDTGSVYKFGHDAFGDLESSGTGTYTSSPKLLESLKGIFVVQASIGGKFSAVLSREGQVYTFSWGREARLGHASELTDVEPRLLSGPLENALVVQIAAGYCYLLMLAYQPTGMSVYSVGCGQGGKLGHGDKRNLVIPALVQHFHAQDVKPLSIYAGAFHCAALALDGRVFTWGWSGHGCLGHGNVGECVCLPTEVKDLKYVKARHLSAGDYTTFVVADNGDVYFFGSGTSLLVQADGVEKDTVLTPKLATSIVALNEKIAQISATHAWDYQGLASAHHTLVLTESGRLYSFGGGEKGQLGVKLVEGQEGRSTLDRVDIDGLA